MIHISSRNFFIPEFTAAPTNPINNSFESLRVIRNLVKIAAINKELNNRVKLNTSLKIKTKRLLIYFLLVQIPTNKKKKRMHMWKKNKYAYV